MDILYLLPVEESFRIIEWENKQKTNQVNSESFTNAQGWASIINGFSSGDSKVSYSDLLPFKSEDNSGLSLKQGLNQPTEETLKLISQLNKQNRLPLKVKKAISGIGLLQKITNL